MDARVEPEPRLRTFPLAPRGGEAAALDFGPEDRPVDLVFCHANGFNARTYRTILGPLGAELRILAPDLRGHGATTLPADPHGFAGWHVFADDLLALLQAATDRPVALAGHSLGASTCLLAAAAAPERVRALVLFEPVMPDPDPKRQAAMAQTARRRRETFPDRATAMDAYRGRGAFAAWSEAQLADFAAAGLHETPRGQVRLACRPTWEAAIYAMQVADPLALAQVRCPVRVLVGEEASTVSDQAKADARALGARVEIAPGTSHFLPMERPELVRQILREAAA